MWHSPSEPLEPASSAHTSTLDSGLQNWERINLYLFKPPVCAPLLRLLQETDTEAVAPAVHPRPRRVYEFQGPEIKINAAAASVHVHIDYDGFPAATETNMYGQALYRGSVPPAAPCRLGVRPGGSVASAPPTLPGTYPHLAPPQLG